MKITRLVGSLGILILLLGIMPTPQAHADTPTCEADIDPSSAIAGVNTSFNASIQNTSLVDIQWFQVTSPSSDYTIVSTDINGWTADNQADSTIISGGDLVPGDTLHPTITLSIPSSSAQTSDWTTLVSDDPSGANPVTCYGTHSLTTSPAPLAIQNINLSNLTSNSIDISWQTNNPSLDQANYGKTDSYGLQTAAETSAGTDHHLTLSNLSANSGYHFQIFADDGNGDTTTSQDSTFLTPKSVPVANQANKPPLNLPVTNPGDKTPPIITLSTVLPKVVQSIPPIRGGATDDLAVARVEYSTNGGRDWLPVDSTAGLGGKTVSFMFIPNNLDDGNYKILARAIDGGGNITATAPLSVVVDRLPPLIGNSVVSLGPQVLTSSNGQIMTQAGVDEKITLSAVGGPISINLTTEDQAKATLPQAFGLSQSQDSGLWSGIISFKKAGTYTLTANSLDGAGNKTTKPIGKVTALPAGQLTDSTTKKPVSGTVTVYAIEPDTNSWVVWDGSPYGQANPQGVGKDGQFSFLLPAGRYYLSAGATKHHNLKSNIFELSQPSPISTAISLNPGRDFKLLSWLNWSSQDINLNSYIGTKADSTNKLIGKLVSRFNLTSVNGQSVKDVTLLAKPTDLVFMNTWAPTAGDQMPDLSRLAQDKDINIELVGSQQNAALLGAYNEISGYNLNWLADPDSTTSQNFSTPSLPTHYFIDRNGVVRHVISGVLNKQEILNELGGL